MEDREGDYLQRSNHSYPWALDGMSGQRSAPATLSHGTALVPIL